MFGVLRALGGGPCLVHLQCHEPRHAEGSGAVRGLWSQGMVGPQMTLALLPQALCFPSLAQEPSTVPIPQLKKRHARQNPSFLQRQLVLPGPSAHTVPWRQLLWRSKDRAGVRSPGSLSWLCPPWLPADSRPPTLPPPACSEHGCPKNLAPLGGTLQCLDAAFCSLGHSMQRQLMPA